MLTRRLAIRPLPGTAHPSGATVYTCAEGAIAVLSVPTSAEVKPGVRALGERLGAEGFKGTVIVLPPGHEFTLCDVDDGAPARWEEDGLPSYAALQQEVAALRFALEQVAPRVGAAACGPAFLVMP